MRPYIYNNWLKISLFIPSIHRKYLGLTEVFLLRSGKTVPYLIAATRIPQFFLFAHHLALLLFFECQHLIETIILVMHNLRHFKEPFWEPENIFHVLFQLPL